MDVLGFILTMPFWLIFLVMAYVVVERRIERYCYSRAVDKYAHKFNLVRHLGESDDMLLERIYDELERKYQ
jgi:hypothetical protein